MITVNQAPALVTKSSFMCWYPGVAGLVAVPLLLLEVEVEVLLQVVGVKLALGGHNCHLRGKFNWALFLFIFGVTHVGSLASGSPNWRQHLVRSLFSIDGHIFLKMILGHTRFSTNQVSFYLFSFPRKKKSSEDEDEDDEDDGEDDPGDDPYPLLQATNALGGDYGLRDLKLE